MELKIDNYAPNFQINNNGKDLSLNEINKNIILYFYPKDNTPGCTIQAQEFAKLHSEFEKLDTLVIGVSKDSDQSHDKFKQKYDLPFDLISDKEGSLCETYDVWKQKTFMGKKYMGILRETYIIAKDKKIKHIFKDVKAKGHADEVLNLLKLIF